MSEMLCISRSEVTQFLSSSALSGKIDASLDAEIKQQLYEYHGSVSLGERETIKRFTVVGDCFVEKMMGKKFFGKIEGDFHLLALH
jgi:hypothetical protein